MRPWIAFVPLLVACEGGTLVNDTGNDDTGSDTADTDAGDTDDTDTGDTSSSSCSATLTYQSPADDETNVSVNKIITIRFSAPVGDGDWSLAVDGVTGTTALAQNGLSATFTPAYDLTVDTGYTLRASVCDADAVTTFHTASGPVEASNLEGRSYAVAYEDVTWVQPAGIGSLIATLGGGFEYLLLAVLDVDEGAETITMAGSPGVTDDTSGDTVQDPCTAPTTFEPADFSGNPVVEVGPADFTFDAGGTPVTIQAAHYKAAFVDDGAAIEDIDISGQIDSAAISAGIGFSPCGLLVTCVACLDNPSSQTCIDVRLTADNGAWVEGLVFDPALDPSLNPSCN